MAKRAYTTSDSSTGRCFCDTCWTTEDGSSYEFVELFPFVLDTDVLCERCGRKLDTCIEVGSWTVSTYVPRGVDASIHVVIDGRTYEGAVTLIPSERDPSVAVTWGLNYYHWLGGEITSYIDNVLIQSHRFPSDLLDLIRGAVCDSARKNHALDQLSNT
jgi:hypothetical protein